MPRLLPLLVSQRFQASVENPRLRLRDALRLDIFERMHSASLRTGSRARAAKLDESRMSIEQSVALGAVAPRPSS